MNLLKEFIFGNAFTLEKPKANLLVRLEDVLLLLLNSFVVSHDAELGLGLILGENLLDFLDLEE